MNIVKYLRSQESQFADWNSYWRAMVRRYRPRTKANLQSLLDREETWKDKLHKQGRSFRQVRDQGLQFQQGSSFRLGHSNYRSGLQGKKRRKEEDIS